MSIFTFTNPATGQKFEVETPATFTEAQARQIFEQQLDAGSLVGLRPGDAINSASQLAGGLQAAASQVGQALSGIAGSAGGALTGALDKAKQAASALPSTDLLGTAQSVASRALSGITNAVNNLVPSNPINVADLAKQASALTPIKGLDLSKLRATMSQAAKLTGQAPTMLSDDKGLGQFGFDASQLERAGVLKPGTTSTYLANGTNSLTSVLKSPAVWTGVNGITSAETLLASVPKQNLIQQDLMSQGLNAVKNLGIPTDKLTPSALAGTALNAAKSITDTVNWAKGAPLPADVKTAFNQVSRDAAFAADFASAGVGDAVLQQDPAAPAIDTADRATLDAAATRVTGSAKIPPVNYQSQSATTAQQQTLDSLAKKFEEIRVSYRELSQRSKEYKTVAPVSTTETDPVKLSEAVTYVENVLIADLETLKDRLGGVLREAQVFLDKYEVPVPNLGDMLSILNLITQGITGYQVYIERVKARLAIISA